MVNRIDDNYITYTKTKNVNIANTDEKFSLDYNKEKTQMESGEKEAKTDESAKKQKQAAEQNGVRLELSSSARTVSTDRLNQGETNKSASEASQQSLFGMIRDIVNTAVSAVKDFFYKIWNEPEEITETTVTAETVEIPAEQQEETTEPAIQETAEVQKMNEERLDREIQPYLRKGDLNQVISLLTDNGKKSVAMNSTLLTYYDRNGKMVEINASDRERILRGDRNTRQL